MKMVKEKKASLFGRRYEFDEENLFSHSHDPEMEGPEFPYWKPVWVDNCWQFQNDKGNYFAEVELSRDPLFPSFWHRFVDAKFYKMTPIFFVDWAQKLAYYRSTQLYLATEAKLYADAPDFDTMKPKEVTAFHKSVDKACEKAVGDYFRSLM